MTAENQALLIKCGTWIVFGTLAACCINTAAELDAKRPMPIQNVYHIDVPR